MIGELKKMIQGEAIPSYQRRFADKQVSEVVIKEREGLGLFEKNGLANNSPFLPVRVVIHFFPINIEKKLLMF